MKLSLYLLFIFIIPTISFSQASGDEIWNNIYTFGQWESKDKSAHIFADVCNVRASADSKADVAGKLTIGTQVQILEVSKINYTQSGISAPWVKIKSSSVTGYVWGGLLSKGVLKLNDGNQVLWGVTEIRKKDEYISQTFVSVRIANGGGIISKQDFEVKQAGNPNTGYLSLLGTPLLEGVDNVIVFNTVSEACGVYASMNYMLYSNGKLIHVGAGYSMGDGGMLHTSKEYVFPYETDVFKDFHFFPGKGHVFIVQDDGHYDDNCVWIETKKVKEFIWDGEVLTKYCDQ